MNEKPIEPQKIATDAERELDFGTDSAQASGRSRFTALFTLLYILACLLLVLAVPAYIVLKSDSLKIGLSPIFSNELTNASLDDKTEGLIIIEPLAGADHKSEGLIIIEPLAVVDHKITIMVTGTKNVRSANSEVWVTNIVKDDIQMELSTIPINNGWELKTSGIVSYRKMYQPCLLNLDADFESSFSISFTKHSLSGLVAIFVDNVYVKTIDLFEPADSTIARYTLRFEHAK